MNISKVLEMSSKIYTFCSKEEHSLARLISIYALTDRVC
jgi:hypothetical protein